MGVVVILIKFETYDGVGCQPQFEDTKAFRHFCTKFSISYRHLCKIVPAVARSRFGVAK